MVWNEKFQVRFPLTMLAVVALLTVPPMARAQMVNFRVPLVTRLVKIYAGYERRLAEAINSKSTAEINRLVGQDFELLSVDNMNAPTLRADWIDQSLREPAASISIGDMSVYNYGSIRVVNFVMTREVSGHKSKVAVIDVWKHSGKTSVLKLRYAGIQPTHPQAVPGEVRQKKINKRY